VRAAFGWPDKVCAWSRPRAGRAGSKAFTETCQADFDATTRMCKTTEVLETVVWPTTLTGSAWVLPVLVPGLNAGNDASGATASSPGALSCDAWSNEGSNGLAVGSTGSMATRSCGNPIPVACCKPVRMPKPAKK
jgi:hypothetical protein